MESVKKNNETKVNELKDVVLYDATFIDKTWRVGTKNDPKKEYGIVKFNVEIKMAKPTEDGTDTYIQSIEEFVFDKENFPVEHINRYTPVKVAYMPPVGNPQGKMRFVKILL